MQRATCLALSTYATAQARESGVEDEMVGCKLSLNDVNDHDTEPDGQPFLTDVVEATGYSQCPPGAGSTVGYASQCDIVVGGLDGQKECYPSCIYQH